MLGTVCIFFGIYCQLPPPRTNVRFTHSRDQFLYAIFQEGFLELPFDTQILYDKKPRKQALISAFRGFKSHFHLFKTAASVLMRSARHASHDKFHMIWCKYFFVPYHMAKIVIFHYHFRSRGEVVIYGKTKKIRFIF